MNNKLVINYTPGPTMLHKLTGFTKVFLFLVMSAVSAVWLGGFNILILMPFVLAALSVCIYGKPWDVPVFAAFLALEGFVDCNLDCVAAFRCRKNSFDPCEFLCRLEDFGLLD